MADDGHLRLRASADFARLEKEVVSMRGKLERLEKGVGGITTRFGSMESRAQRALTSMVSRAQSAVLSYVGIHEAIALVNQALREQIRLNEQASQTTITVADAKKGFLQLAGELNQEQQERLLRRAVEIGLPAQFTEAESIRAAQEALSATSGTDAEQRIADSIETMSTVMPLFQGQTEAMLPMVSAVLDAQRTLGEGTEEVVNFLLAAVSQTRLSKLEDLPNLIRAMAASQAITEAEDPLQNAKDLAAAFGTLQAVTADAPGAMSSTAASNFSATMVKAMEQTGRPLGELIFGTMKSLTEDPTLLDDITFLGKSGQRLIQPKIVQEGGGIAEIFRKNQAAMDRIDATMLARTQARMEGEFDLDILLDRMMGVRKAIGEKLIKDTRQTEGAARRMTLGPFGALVAADEGVVDSIGRMSSHVISAAFRGVDTQRMLVEQQLAERTGDPQTRTLSAAIGALMPFGRLVPAFRGSARDAARAQADFMGIPAAIPTTEQLLARDVGRDDIARNLQETLRALLVLQKLQLEEQKKSGERLKTSSNQNAARTRQQGSQEE